MEIKEGSSFACAFQIYSAHYSLIAAVKFLGSKPFRRGMAFLGKF
jgi:hypothetical protein